VSFEQIAKTYQVHIFVDNSEMETNAETISKLLEAFKDLNLLPNYGKEFILSSGHHRDFIKLVSSAQDLIIEFPSNEIVMHFNNNDVDITLINNVLDKLASLFPDKKSNRLSMLTSASFSKGKQDNYNKVFENIFRYENKEAFEWEHRIAERGSLPNDDGLLNQILTYRRGHFLDGRTHKRYDAIGIDIDINTVPKQEPTYTFSKAKHLIESMLDTNNQMKSEALEKMPMGE